MPLPEVYQEPFHWIFNSLIAVFMLVSVYGLLYELFVKVGIAAFEIVMLKVGIIYLSIRVFRWFFMVYLIICFVILLSKIGIKC